MFWFLIIVGFLLMIIALINIIHFIKRRRESKSEAQTYFIILFVFFVLMGFNNFIIGLIEIKYTFVSYGISAALVFFLLASGMGLVQKWKWAKIVGTIGLTYSIVFISVGQADYFNTWGIDELSIQINQIVSTVITIISLFILGYYLIKTRLSPLVGLFFGILFPTIQFIIVIISGNPLNDAVNVSIIFVVNVIMYLGFKGKLTFMEKQ